MRDVFYTILVVWIVMRIYNSFFSAKPQQPPAKREGEVTINNNSNPSTSSNNKGEYVDYEEIKD
jgi:hypothetical protein